METARLCVRSVPGDRAVIQNSQAARSFRCERLRSARLSGPEGSISANGYRGHSEPAAPRQRSAAILQQWEVGSPQPEVARALTYCLPATDCITAA